MEPNPYNPGSIPSYLAGRAQERTLIRDRLARITQLGRSGGPLLGFHAPRGLGKTSLLRAAQRDAEDSGFLTVWVTGRPDSPLASALARELSRAVSGVLPVEGGRGLRDRLEEVEVQLGVPGVAQVGATFDASESDPFQGGGVVEELLEDTARVAVQHERPGLAVFVDEFQELPLTDRTSVLHALQHFDGAPHGCQVAVVAAGLPSLPDAVVEAATFGERSTFQDLNLLSAVSVAEAIRLPAEASEVTWTNDAVEAAIEVAQGYPHMVQLIGQQTWEGVRPERGEVIEAGAVRAGVEGARERMTTLYNTRLSKSSPEEQRFLHAMAEEGDTAITRRAIARRLGVESNALSRPRDGLIGRGIIEPDGRGTVRFTVPGFGGYLRSVTAHDPARASWNQDL